MSEIIKFNCDKFSIIKDDPRFIVCRFYFGLIGENYNGSVLELEDYENNKGTVGYTPICGYFSGSDFKKHDPKEYPLGTILSFDDCDYSYEELEDEKKYASALGIIQKEYLSKEAENILKSGTKKISLEIEVFKKKKLANGKFRFTEWIYQCITILGDKMSQGMGIAHLEVLNKPREAYASFCLNTIETFSSNQTDDDEIDINKNKDNSLESEDEEMTFNKVEFAQQHGMTAGQIRDMMNDECNKIKYKNGDYEYSKYWVSDYDKKYAYCFNYELSKYEAVPYKIEDSKCIMDFEHCKTAKSVQTWVVEGEEENMPETDLMEELICKIVEKLNSEKEKMMKDMEEKEHDNMETMSKKDDTILKIGQELDTVKEQYSAQVVEIETYKADNKTLKAEITKYSKEKKEKDAEVILTKYSKKISEDERKELFGKLEKFNTVEDFEKEVKAFVCDKYEAEIKGNKKEFNTYSRMSTNTNPEVKSDGTRWTDYIKDYKQEV